MSRWKLHEQIINKTNSKIYFLSCTLVWKYYTCSLITLITLAIKWYWINKMLKYKWINNLDSIKNNINYIIHTIKNINLISFTANNSNMYISSYCCEKFHSEALYVILIRQSGVRELIIHQGAIHLLHHHWVCF